MPLEVPKCEIFARGFFALSEPIWIGDLGTEPKNGFFHHMTPDFDGFRFFAANWVCGKQKRNLKLGPNYKLVVIVFGPTYMPTKSFLKIFKCLGLLCMFKSFNKSLFLYRILSIGGKIFTVYSVHMENFLPHTQCTWQIFYRILSRCGIIFIAYSVHVEYFLPHT
jgi:hypothetical protein